MGLEYVSVNAQEKLKVKAQTGKHAPAYSTIQQHTAATLGLVTERLKTVGTHLD